MIASTSILWQRFDDQEANAVSRTNTHVRNPLEYQRGHRGLVHAMVFDFVEQLKNLLSDHHIFGNLDNLDVNKANHYGKFERNDGHVHEVNSGSGTMKHMPT